MTPFVRAAILAVLLVAGNSPTQAAPASADPPAAGKRPVTGFNVVEIGGALTADVTVGPAFSVEVSGDPASVALVTTKVQGQTLVVGRERSSRTRGKKVLVSIKLPVLHGIELNGASEAVVTGLKGDGLRAGASGASHLKVKEAKGAHLALDVSGASSVEIAGAIDNLVTDVSGASHVKGRDLVVRKAVVDVSGASTLKLNGKDVSGDASGASTVQVWGAPQRLAVETSGASSVRSMQ